MSSPVRTRFVFKCRWCGRVRYSADPHQLFCNKAHEDRWAARNVPPTLCADLDAPRMCTGCANYRPLRDFLEEQNGEEILHKECLECRTPLDVYEFEPPPTMCVDCKTNPSYGRRRCPTCEKDHIRRYVKSGGDYCRTALDTTSGVDDD